ncbi:hypothetical protein BS47DRAFT_1362539 [Hydnum rufescens UP504]|uniref:Uncharacterized protein n=1 Tax=Hydnum rufescens UP504 TaxID=1448309 RepID=A0A9P6AYY1_9AGAM|nr:hypothetical protein BS47DRAFT_1362539 [Hydnum rufescens UP504]
MLIPVSPSKGRVPPDTVFDEDIEPGLLDVGQDEGPLRAVHYIQAPHHKCYQAVDEPLKTWIPYWDAFLDALLWHEGRGDGLQVLGCPACNIPGESGCCLRWHARLPFHRVKEWQGLHFEAVALADLGLCVQLNHVSNKQDSVQSKVSTIHFYQALEQETSNMGLVNIKSCYTAFL